MEKVEEHDKKGQCKNIMESVKAKKLQSEIPLKYDEEDYYRSQRNSVNFLFTETNEHGRN